MRKRRHVRYDDNGDIVSIGVHSATTLKHLSEKTDESRIAVDPKILEENSEADICEKFVVKDGVLVKRSKQIDDAIVSDI